MPRVSKEKNQEYQRKWYQDNKKLQISRNRANTQKKIDWVREYKKDKCCIKCGENHLATLDFHHRVPENKIESPFFLATRNVSLQRVIDEIDKCDILCANCHRKLHWEEKRNLAPVA